MQVSYFVSIRKISPNKIVFRKNASAIQNFLKYFLLWKRIPKSCMYTAILSSYFVLERTMHKILPIKYFLSLKLEKIYPL